MPKVKNQAKWRKTTKLGSSLVREKDKGFYDYLVNHGWKERIAITIKAGR